MIKMKKFNIFLAAGALLSILSCKKSENLNRNIVGLGGETWVQTPLDNWLTDNFTKPYNIDVKYRWDGSETDISKTLTPPKAEKVQPTMQIVKACWIDVYTSEIGQPFIQKFAPRQYLLVGSLQYNGTTVTLGEAEGGNRVTLFDINNFDPTNGPRVKRILKTIHHEFTHILNQNVNFAKEFERITPSGYTSDWNNTTLASANAAGYISQYAQAAPGEDYAEMASIMLTEGKSSYDAKVNGIVVPKLDSIPDPANPPFIIVREMPNVDAQAAIRKKELSVIDYFKQSFNIDFPRLQRRTNYALYQNASIELNGLFGNNKQYTSLSVDPDKNPGMSADFMTAYNAAKTGLNGIGSRVLNNFVLFFYPKAGELVLRVNYTSGTTAFMAHFVYKVTYNANQEMTLTFVRQDGNANTVAPGIVALTNYISTGSFFMKWRFDSDMKEYGQWTNAVNPSSFLYGDLGVIKY
jgi:substrate import-associated zinc metallohydrolase lipoprotein